MYGSSRAGLHGACKATKALVLAAVCSAALWSLQGCDRTTSAWPSATIRVEVGYIPGGGADGLAEMLAHELGRSLHSRVSVAESRSAATANLAVETAAHAPSDGYTLLVASADVLVVSPLLERSTETSTEPSACPLQLLAETPHVLVVLRDSSFDTIDDVMRRARSFPGRLTYGSLHSESTTYVLADYFARTLQLDMTHVPYRSHAAAMRDLLGGEVAMTFTTLQAALPSIRTGRVRALAISSEQRVPELPDVPTFAESDLPEMTSSSWHGLFVPCGIPRDVEGQLITAARDIATNPDFTAMLGVDPAVEKLPTGEDFGDFVRDERERWLSRITRVEALARTD